MSGFQSFRIVHKATDRVVASHFDYELFSSSVYDRTADALAVYCSVHHLNVDEYRAVRIQ